MVATAMYKMRENTENLMKGLGRENNNFLQIYEPSTSIEHKWSLWIITMKQTQEREASPSEISDADIILDPRKANHSSNCTWVATSSRSPILEKYQKQSSMPLTR